MRHKCNANEYKCNTMIDTNDAFIQMHIFPEKVHLQVGCDLVLWENQRSVCQLEIDPTSNPGSAAGTRQHNTYVAFVCIYM